MPANLKFWAGSEESLSAYLASVKKFELMGAAEMQAAIGSSSSDGPDVPRLFNQVGGVAVISINGSLVNNSNWYNEYAGATGYPEIRDALVHAVNEPTVGAIVLDINSGGGAVSGVSDTADLIKKIDSMKPVHTFSDGAIASAAYWLGASARSVDIGKVTEAGSLGVLTVHKEYSQMMKNDGINATVLRAGEFKALGNPYEVLSEKAKDEIQGQLDMMYGMFISHVAEARGVSYPVADQKMGQGRVFLGTQAVDVGLADSITTFDAVVSAAQGAIDKKKSSSQYGANFSKGPAMKVALTDQQIAIAALAGTLTQDPVLDEAEALRVAAEADAAAAEAAAAALAAAAAPAAAAPVDAAKAESDIVAFLKTSLSEAQASVLDLTVQLRDSKSASEAMASNHAAMRVIASASVTQLRVALGGASGTTEALADDALLAEHANLRSQFESKFKSGGVAAVSSTSSSDKKSEVADPARQARLASTRFAT